MSRWMNTIRRRPVTSTAALLAVAVLVCAGVHVWAILDYQAAGRALDEDRLTDADDEIALCLAVWPWSADAHFMAARIARVNGAFPEAEAQLDECRRLEQGPTTRTQRETLLLRAQQGEVDEVGADLLSAADHGDGDEREILEALARGNMLQMHYVTAEGLLDRCLALHPDDVRALDWRGWVLERLQQPGKAARDYEQALKLSPGRTAVRLRLAELFLDLYDAPSAELHLRIAEKADPKQPDALLGLARCRFLQGRLSECGDLLDRVLAARPEDATALLYRGKLAMQGDSPRPEEAESYFRRALKAAPNDPEVHWAMHLSLGAQPGRESEADAELKRFNELFAVARRIQDIMANELDQSPTNPEPAYELAKLNLSVGDDDLARHWLRTALRRDPHHKAAQALLAEIDEKKGR